MLELKPIFSTAAQPAALVLAAALAACQPVADAEKGPTAGATTPPVSAATPAGATPVQEGTDPYITVKDTRRGGPGDAVAWWLRDMDIRPNGHAVSGVSLDAINAHAGKTSPRWCSANAMSRSSFVAASPETQAEIEQSMADTAVADFDARGVNITGTGPQDAVVGSFLTCDGDVGSFLLITDREAQPNIVKLEEWPDWRGLIWLRERDGGLFVGGCFECGEEVRIDLPAGAFPDFKR